MSNFSLAFAGATISESIAPQLTTSVRSATDQVDTTFQKYLQQTGTVNWTAPDTLFSLWFGINDVLTYYQTNASSVLQADMDQYKLLIETVSEKIKCLAENSADSLTPGTDISLRRKKHFIAQRTPHRSSTNKCRTQLLGFGSTSIRHPQFQSRTSKYNVSASTRALRCDICAPRHLYFVHTSTR